MSRYRDRERMEFSGACNLLCDSFVPIFVAGNNGTVNLWVTVLSGGRLSRVIPHAHTLLTRAISWCKIATIYSRQNRSRIQFFYCRKWDDDCRNYEYCRCRRKKRTRTIVGIIGIIGTVSECQANIIYWYRLLQQAVVTRASARFLNN